MVEVLKAQGACVVEVAFLEQLPMLGRHLNQFLLAASLQKVTWCRNEGSELGV